MKMKHLIIIGIIIVSVFLFFFLKKEKNINNINELTFSYSTGNYMNASVSYELVCKDKCILSFKDDGVYRALELADILKENAQSISTALEKACRWVPEAPLDFLEELEEYKELLIDEYLPANDFRVRKENLAINQILDEVTERIKNNPLDPAEKKNAVLSSFISELRTNPEGVWNTLLEYNPVFAATVQQVEGSEISKSRRGMGLDTIETGETPYEYVIVDEAARVAPPDLMIPS